MESTLEVTAIPEDAVNDPEQVAAVTLYDYSFTGVPVILKAGRIYDKSRPCLARAT